jgi:hypothetical protein
MDIEDLRTSQCKPIARAVAVCSGHQIFGQTTGDVGTNTNR